MAFYEFTSSSVLYASQMNELMKQSMIQTADSSEYPDASHRREGMFVYDMDEHALKQFTTGATGWTAPWNLPWGYVQLATTTTVTGSIGSTFAPLTGLSVSWNSVANRKYKITGFVDLAISIAGSAKSITGVRIADGSGAKKAISQVVLSDQEVATHTIMEIVSGTGSSMTRQLTAAVSNGATGATQSNVNGTHFISVEDIGPVLSAGPA